MTTVEVTKTGIPKMAPTNQVLNDIPQYIREKNLGRVTSSLIFLPSTVEPHPEGLYSTTIFGPIGTPTRLAKHGYIDLKVEVFHPDVYEDLLRLNRLYGQIMSGRKTAVFDEDLKDFIDINKVGEELKPNQTAGTGYHFFFTHFPRLVFRETGSNQRADRIKFINLYKKERIVTKWPVLPAGLRDIKIKDITERPEIEESNNFYTKLLLYTNAIPDGAKTDNSIWDGVRFSIQKQLHALNCYFLDDLLGDKTGFIQGKVTSRSVAYANRNVLIGTKLSASSARGHKQTILDTKIPIFQAAKGYVPLVIHHLNRLFIQNIIDVNTSKTIYASDVKTLEFKKLEPTEHDISNNFSRKALENRIENFGVASLRHLPYVVKIRKAYYFPFLCYDNHNTILIFRNLAEFKQVFKDKTGHDLDISKVRPMTNIEVMYIAVEAATKGKYISTTRYPALGLGSKYPSRPMVMTTDPGRVIRLINVLSPAESGSPVTYYEWPVLDGLYADGYRVHPLYLPKNQLGGDYDGDKVNCIPYWGEDTCAEIASRLNRPSALLTSSGKLRLTIDCEITGQTMKNLSIVKPRRTR